MPEETTLANNDMGANERVFDLQLFADDAPPADDGTPPTDQTPPTDDAPPTDQPADDKPPADEPPKDTPPTDDVDPFTDYKPDLPDGINEEILLEALPIFKEMGLDPSKANMIMPLADKLVQSTVAKVVEDINQQCEANYQEVMDSLANNRKAGGKVEFEKSVGQVNALFEKYGATPEQLHTALTAMAGFDKESVKPFFIALTKMAKDAADDVTLLGGQKPKQQNPRFPGLRP